MALWKDTNTTGGSPAPAPNLAATSPTPFSAPESRPAPAPVPSSDPAPRAGKPTAELKESVIAAGLTIEGKIEGAGHVRISGRFKGDVHVDGDLTIEQGAHVAGQVRASTVVVAGELQGNIDTAKKVDLQQTGVITGDVKAGSLTVAAGSRMRGQVEFGWEDKPKGSTNA